MKDSLKTHADIELLASIEGSDTYRVFCEFLTKKQEEYLSRLLRDSSLRQEDEHDYLTKLRTYHEILSYLPGKKISLRDQLYDFQKQSEAMKREEFRLRNEARLKRMAQSLGLSQNVERMIARENDNQSQGRPEKPHP